MEFQEKVQRLIKTGCVLDKNRPIVVGFSGGADSLGLLHVLWRLGYSVQAVHFNHHLRPEAGEEARYAQQLAEQIGVPFAIGEGDVPAYKSQVGGSVEDVARKMRYTFLFEQARRVDAQAIAVAHTANDQVETILYHMIRGTGLDGLVGMRVRSFLEHYDPELPLVRPFLCTWREEIENYLEVHRLTPLVDPSNFEHVYIRNRIRHELLPVLETYNTEVGKAVWRMGQTLQADREFLESQTDLAYKTCLAFSKETSKPFQRKPFQVLAIALQRRVLRRAISTLFPGNDIGFEKIETLRSAILSEKSNGQWNVSAGIVMEMDSTSFAFRQGETQLLQVNSPQLETNLVNVRINAQTQLSPGWVLDAKMLPANLEEFEEIKKNENPFQAWFDGVIGETGLIFRWRKPGDVVRGMGMEGKAQKISDLMVNLKVPQHLRQKWPILVSGDQVIWVPGLKVSEAYKVTAQTREILYLRLTSD